MYGMNAHMQCYNQIIGLAPVLAFFRLKVQQSFYTIRLSLLLFHFFFLVEIYQLKEMTNKKLLQLTNGLNFKPQVILLRCLRSVIFVMAIYDLLLKSCIFCIHMTGHKKRIGFSFGAENKST